MRWLIFLVLIFIGSTAYAQHKAGDIVHSKGGYHRLEWSKWYGYRWVWYAVPEYNVTNNTNTFSYTFNTPLAPLAQQGGTLYGGTGFVFPLLDPNLFIERAARLRQQSADNERQGFSEFNATAQQYFQLQADVADQQERGKLLEAMKQLLEATKGQSAIQIQQMLGPIPVEFQPLANLTATACVRCHSGPNPKGALDLSGPKLSQLTEEQLSKIDARVTTDVADKRMPPDKPLPDGEILAFVRAIKKIPVRESGQ